MEKLAAKKPPAKKPRPASKPVTLRRDHRVGAPLKKGVFPRRVALRALMRLARKGATIPVSLEEGGLNRLTTQEAALAWNLLYTAVRHTGPVLSALPKHLRKQALSGAPFGAALWLAVTDAALLGTTHHAAVDLWVEAMKAVGGAKAAGALNATLRGLLAQPLTLDETALHPGDMARVFDRFGPTAAARLRQGLTQHAPLARWPLDEEDWEAQGFAVSGWPAVMDFAPLKLGDEGSALKRQVAGGQFLLLDPGSVFLALNLPLGQSLLDLCAGAGIKSRVAQCRQTPPATHVMVSPQKVLRLDHWRQGPARRRVVALPKPPPGQTWDTVWVDAPCTGSGTLGRNPEAALRLSPSALKQSAAVQLKLLLDGLSRLKPGGKLVYLTCSLHEEENEQVIRELKKLRPDLKQKSLEGFGEGWPVNVVRQREGAYVLSREPGGDNFFVSVLHLPGKNTRGNTKHP